MRGFRFLEDGESLGEVSRYEFDELAAFTSGAEDAKKTKRPPPPKNPSEAGGRNNYFTSRAGKLRRDGFESEAILAAIRAENSR